jgi:hypothetical protein
MSIPPDRISAIQDQTPMPFVSDCYKKGAPESIVSNEG